MRTVRRDQAEYDIKSPTCYEFNKTRVEEGKVRRDIAKPSKKSLTSCQANRTSEGVRVMRRDQLDMTWNHSLSIKPTEPEWG